VPCPQRALELVGEHVPLQHEGLGAQPFGHPPAGKDTSPTLATLGRVVFPAPQSRSLARPAEPTTVAIPQGSDTARRSAPRYDLKTGHGPPAPQLSLLSVDNPFGSGPARDVGALAVSSGWPCEIPRMAYLRSLATHPHRDTPGSRSLH